MTKEKPSIPADLRRRVLVEAGHRCAIQTCRSLDVDIHHIIPWETCKKHEYKNLIALCLNCHRRADKGQIDRRSLRMYKNNLRFLYDKFTIFEIDILFELNKRSQNQPISFPSHSILLLKRIIESGYVKWVKQPPIMNIGGIKISYDLLSITERGQEFINSLSLEEMGY
ncbi:MAG: HNH endonuclease [Candidatus Methanofastidiosia archaeon]